MQGKKDKKTVIVYTYGTIYCTYVGDSSKLLNGLSGLKPHLHFRRLAKASYFCLLMILLSRSYWYLNSHNSIQMCRDLKYIVSVIEQFTICLTCFILLIYQTLYISFQTPLKQVQKLVANEGATFTNAVSIRLTMVLRVVCLKLMLSNL